MNAPSTRATKSENLFEGTVSVYLNPKVLAVLVPIFVVQDVFIAAVLRNPAILVPFLALEAAILWFLYQKIFKNPTQYTAYLNEQFLIVAGKHQSISYPIREIDSLTAFTEQKSGKLFRGVKVICKERSFSLLLENPDALVAAFREAK